MRELFEVEADALHDAFLHKRGVTEEAQLQDHRAHLKAFLLRKEARSVTDDEFRDLQAMRQQHGVAPVSDSVKQWGQERVGRKQGGGLWTIISSFRADKVAKDLGDRKRTIEKTNQKRNTSHMDESDAKGHGLQR